MCLMLKQGRKFRKDGVNEHTNEQMNEQAADLYLFRLCLHAFRCCSGHAIIGKVWSLQAGVLLEGGVICCIFNAFCVC